MLGETLNNLSHRFKDARRKRTLKREIRRVDQHFRQRVKAAATDEDREALEAEWSAETEFERNELLAIESRQLARIARRWEVEIPHQRWVHDDPRTGHTYLDSPGKLATRREIKQAKRESNKWRLQKLAFLIGVMGLLLTVYLQRDKLWPSPTTPPATSPGEPNAPTGNQPEPSEAPAPSPRGVSPPAPVAPPNPAPTLPSPEAATVSPATIAATACPPEITDSEPRVTVHTGDIVVAAGGGLYRLDGTTFRETHIVSGDYLTSVRGIAVQRDGQILVTTQACRQGALVRIDPMTGTQTPIALAFRTSWGIAIEPDGKTALVGDENPRDTIWGEILRVDLQTGARKSIHVLRGDATATTIAIHPKSGEVFFTARAVYRFDEKTGTARRLNFEGTDNIQAMTITPQGEMYLAEYNGGPVTHVRPGNQAPLASYRGFPTAWSIAPSLDGKTLFVTSSGGTNGAVYKVDVPSSSDAPVLVWKGRPGGLGVFVAVVGRLDPRATN